MSKYIKEIPMEFKGQIYKMAGKKAIIRPDEFKQNRQDVIADNTDKTFKIGDRVAYDHYENNGRRYTKNIKKLDT